MLRASTLFGSFFSPYRDFRATENLSIQKNVEASKKIIIIIIIKTLFYEGNT